MEGKLSMEQIEKNNIKEIKKLNQRGGRMLSLIDLLEDNTLNMEMASFLLFSMLNNSSFLTAANPSGTGKTTLMGALLNLLKPGIEIKTVEQASHLDSNKYDLNENLRFLIHEIGNGPYYSYIWGKAVNNFFGLTKKARVTSCIHADTLKELKEIVFNPPLLVEKDYFYNLDLILFMTMEGDFYSRKRRVSSVYGCTENNFIKLYEWNQESDNFNKCNLDTYLDFISNNNRLSKIESEIQNCHDFIEKLKRQDINTILEVRKEILNNFTTY